MINSQKISGMVIVSEAVWGCYPFVESIKSFLPVVDEMIVIFNVYGKNDGTLEALKGINDSKIRIIPTSFDIEKHGWETYGIARTLGYQAAHGDIVLMFDCDGVLHEKDHTVLAGNLFDFLGQNCATGYWEKYRCYKPDLYWDQHKHSGIYNKRILGDRLDFLRDDRKGAFNFAQLTLQEGKSKSFSVILFGYEHMWDTKEVLNYKITRYGRMIDIQQGKSVKTPEEYFQIYMDDIAEGFKKKGKRMDLNNHPLIMQFKIRNLDETHFGYNFFNYKLKV